MADLAASSTDGRAALAVTGLGLVTALGDDPFEVERRLCAGDDGRVPHAPLAALPDPRAALVPGPNLKPWLKRRKDLKLMARPARLALAAAGPALGDWCGDRRELGLYLGVGREPPGSALDGAIGGPEAALAASARDGRLDPELLAGPGRDRYPPLLPLMTLPNMALAHVAIALGVGGANGVWAGGPEASLRAVAAAWWAVAEGRAPAALAGGTDSLVDLGSARDRLRMGATGAPGEAAAFLRIEPAGRAIAPLAWIEAPSAATDAGAFAHRAGLGDCGAADGAIALVLAVVAARRTGGSVVVSAAARGSPSFRVTAVPPAVESSGSGPSRPVGGERRAPSAC